MTTFHCRTFDNAGLNKRQKAMFDSSLPFVVCFFVPALAIRRQAPETRRTVGAKNGSSKFQVSKPARQA
jgi:hypothetical protein